MKLSSFHQITDNAFKDCDLSMESFAKGVAVYNEGDTLNYIRFILEGQISVLKATKVVWIGHTNEFLGLSSYFNLNDFYGNSAITASKVEIIKIKKEDFERALAESKSLSSSIIASLLQRIKYTTENTADSKKMIKKRSMGFY